jgi:UDP-glucose 4-epimerase
MRALVTGAAGFIGSHLVDRLLAAGHQVVGVDNLSSGTLDNLEHAFRYNAVSPGRFIFFRMDIQAPEMTGIVAGSYPDVIFHLAAQVNPQTAVDDPQFDARSNVLGTINVCEASRLGGVRRVVYAASAVSVCAAPTMQAAESTKRSEPLSTWAVAKLAGEMYLRAYAEMYDLAPVCLQFSNVYGPRQNPHGSAGIIPLLGSAMVTGGLSSVHGNDTAAIDIIYVDDVVEAFMRVGCASTELTGTYYVTTGQQTTHAELRHLISTYLDGSSARITAEDSDTEVRVVALAAGEAMSGLGWRRVVDLTSGIERTMHWLCGTLRPEPSISAGV